MRTAKTQVAIVGGGPAGLLLAHMLALEGIDSVVLERQMRSHVLKRIRAGVLEHGTVKLLRDVGISERMDREGHAHDGAFIAWEERALFLIDTQKYTGKSMMAFGQTAITEELYAARDRAGGQIIDGAQNVRIFDVLTKHPHLTFEKDGKNHQIQCDYVAGCDGFHGVSRATIPDHLTATSERSYPFVWLSLMAETPPLPDLVYAQHTRGFALASQRGPQLSRYYIQCDPDAKLADWSDERFWSELVRRFPPTLANRIVTGPAIEKAIVPLRSFVCERMRYGRLMLAGDSAHIVPPTGAKGLNLAVSDVFYLQRALVHAYKHHSERYLDSYCAVALRRIWSAERLSWWLTLLLHEFPDRDQFQQRIRQNEFDHLCASTPRQAALAEEYAGLPFEA